MRGYRFRMNLLMCAKACMKELRRVCYWVERVLGGLRRSQG